jgi:hypothetical protein
MGVYAVAWRGVAWRGVAWRGLAFIIDFILSEKECIHSIQSWDGKEVNLVEIVVGREGGREREGGEDFTLP